MNMWIMRFNGPEFGHRVVFKKNLQGRRHGKIFCDEVVGCTYKTLTTQVGAACVWLADCVAAEQRLWRLLCC